MVDYVRLQASAARLIRKSGVPVTLLKQAAGDYDPASGTVDAPNPGSFPADVVRLAEAIFQGYQVRDATNTLTVDQSVDVLLSVQGAVIALGDQIVMDGKNWRIYGYTAIAPGAIVLLYQAGLCLI